MSLVLIYLAAIVAANLLAAHFGPWITPVNAFLLIGLSLTTRDPLHDRWTHRGLAWKMPLLILAGALLTALLCPSAGHIARASVIAFAASAATDTVAYALLQHRPRPVRVNGSNTASAIIDSLLFPTIAFGTFLPAIVATHAAAKIAGGFLWSLMLCRGE